MTITPKARHITEHIARAMQDPVAQRSIPEIVQGALDEAREEGLQEGIHGCTMIRCIEHISAPQNNTNEITGAECGECARILGQTQGIIYAQRAAENPKA